MIVDGHHHLWRLGEGYTWLDDPALAPIRRTFTPARPAGRAGRRVGGPDGPGGGRLLRPRRGGRAAVLRRAVDLFGPRRLMSGSDWPVCLLAASYGEVKDALSAALPPLTAAERADIFGGTATRVYRL